MPPHSRKCGVAPPRSLFSSYAASPLHSTWRAGARTRGLNGAGRKRECGKVKPCRVLSAEPGTERTSRTRSSGLNLPKGSPGWPDHRPLALRAPILRNCPTITRKPHSSRIPESATSGRPGRTSLRETLAGDPESRVESFHKCFPSRWCGIWGGGQGAVCLSCRTRTQEKSPASQTVSACSPLRNEPCPGCFREQYEFPLKRPARTHRRWWGRTLDRGLVAKEALLCSRTHG